MSRLENMVLSSDVDDLHIFDKSTIIHCLHKAALGVGSIQARERLDKTLALIAWYDQLTRRQATAEVTASLELTTADR